MTIANPTKGRIIVTGILFWYPLAGVAYQFLHYLLGLRRLGYDVFYIEDSARWIYDPVLNDLSPEASGNVSAVVPVLERHGFSERWAFRGAYPGGRCYGMSEQDILRLYREADGFLNVTGAQEMREEHMRLRRRVYVESDPFATQVKVSQGDAGTIAALEAHHVHFTFGENIGTRDCLAPKDERFDWLPTRQPVDLALWESSPLGGEAYSTITTWSNKDKNIVYRGDTYYWTKDREFERFLELPRRRPGVRFELAVRVGGEVPARLAANGWGQIDSVDLSTDAGRYREYIQHSRAEFTVARDQYVRPRTGWFSDRSACYLAAGRPVITQETGFSKYIPSGNGLFGFQTMEDVLAAVDSIESDYRGHCRAAREIAAEYFAAEKVLAHLMSRAGL
jgi:hypothetical protein